MRVEMIVAFLSAAALSGCATAHGMGHQSMSHDEMMQHCQMMEQHQAQGGDDHTQHDPARHGGMSHEQMMQHCAEMRGQQTGEAPPAPHEHQ